MTFEKPKDKECADEGCDSMFTPFYSYDRYCVPCRFKHAKPLKRTPLKRSTQPIKKQSRTAKAFENEFFRRKHQLKKKIIKKHGRLQCQKCAATYSILFSVHHIVYRSEKPKHKHLNTLRNLIYLCDFCHTALHADKKSRNYLIKQRRLVDLFGMVWGYEEYEDSLERNISENEKDNSES